MANLTIANNDARVQYTTNSGGSAGAFTIDFPFFSLDDIKVITTVSGTDTTWTRVASSPNSTQFTVAGTAADDEGFTGGSVTLGAAVLSTVVTIYRDIVIERSSDFPTSGAFNIGSLNTDLDKLSAIAQENNTKYDRSIRLAESDTDVTMVLPNATTRASKGLVFDSSGNTLSAIVYPASASSTTSTVSVGGSATSTASYNTTTGAMTFALGIPTGATGLTGSTGNAATVAVNTVSELSPGATPTVSNAGTTAAANLNFGIPGTAIWSTGNSFPGSPADGDFFLFTAAVGSGLTWYDTNGTSALSTASSADIAKYQTSNTRWVKQVNVIGATGSQGSQGIQGATGNTGATGSNSKWTTGITFPSSSLVNGDLHLFTADVANGLTWKDTNGSTAITAASIGDVAQYQSSGTKWVKQNNIFGATGSTGSQGIQGIQGPAGADGDGTFNNFVLTADSGTNQTVNTTNTVDIAGGSSITTVVGATDTVTINADDGTASAKGAVIVAGTSPVSVGYSSGTATVALGTVPIAKGGTGATTLAGANIPVLNAINTFTKPNRNAMITDNDGSFDMAVGNNFQSTPAGNWAMTFTNQSNGQSGYVLLINSGGHTISLASTTKGSATTAATITAAGTYLISYFSNGTNSYITNSVVYA